jgi:SAM-dependent methyltransferase
LKLPKGARALDLGCGPGTAALHLAGRGFAVTALDMSPDAVAFARTRPGAQAVGWKVGDVFAVRLEGPFDLALDRGLFHVFDDAQRPAYAERLAGWVKPGGFLVLKTFSDAEPPGWGPRRVPRKDIEASFRPSFEVHAWERSTFPGQLDREPKAHLAVLRRSGAKSL